MNRLKKIGQVRIIDDDYVIKEEDDLTTLENYLKSRNYDGFIPIIKREDGYNYYPYLESYVYDKEQLGKDIADNMALLHNKTSYKKEVGEKKNSEIYNNLNGYIAYLTDYFEGLCSKYEYIEFPSPANLLFLANVSKIFDALSFAKRELDNWYKLTKDNTSKRLALVHGNISLEHARYEKQLYLCSWRNAHLETPIYDLIKFYHNDWYKMDFTNILDEYFQKCSLLEDEKKLFFINITLPFTITEKHQEFANVEEVTRLIEYLYRTEKLIGPYYLEKDNKE